MARNYKDISGKNNSNYKTGYAVNGHRPGFYNSWQNMKGRCLRKTHPKYYRYGARGIKICDEWMSIENFACWAINNGWEQGLTLDRIDNDGNYCPQNCRWVTPSENSRKKRTTKLTMGDANEIRKRLSNGENAREIAKEYNVAHGTVWFIEKNFIHVDGAPNKKKK